MAPRVTWKGYMKLSLVSCPVRLYNATSSTGRIAFNEIDRNPIPARDQRTAEVEGAYAQLAGCGQLEKHQT